MKYIDIVPIIRGSNAAYLYKMPEFVVRWLIKLVKQDEMNQILDKYADFKNEQFLSKLIEEFNLKIEIEGKENLPENGRCFFIANHPFGLIDGLVLTKIVSEKYGSLKAIGNEVFMFVPHLHSFIANVSVFGNNSKELLTALQEVYNSDTPITHFPAGEVSRSKGWKVKESPWQKSVISKAISSKRDIVPFYFHGRNSLFFYFVSSFRRALGIKVNIELILLPREMFKKRNKTIRVKIGKPIPWSSFDKSFSHLEWTQQLSSSLYQFGKKNKEIRF